MAVEISTTIQARDHIQVHVRVQCDGSNIHYIQTAFRPDAATPTP